MSERAAVYDRIGRGYAGTRRGDPRIAAQIRAALGAARRVVNVGAGAGSYEPDDVRVIAVEPSREMIRQRAAGTAPVVQAVAERLPFPDHAFDVALATLTVHHWTDRRAGLGELLRVAPRAVVMTWDPACVSWGPPARDVFWLTAHYFPEIDAMDLRRFPSMDELRSSLGRVHVEPVLIPHDCVDGFLGAFWRRPEAYVDATVRRAISGFAQLPPEVVERGVARLAADLAGGEWDRRFGALRAVAEVDLGYRLVTAGAAF